MNVCFSCAHAEAQVVCFPGGDTTCTSIPIAGGASSAEACCFIPSRGGLGGGSYSAVGGEQCINCMTVVGKGMLCVCVYCMLC